MLRRAKKLITAGVIGSTLAFSAGAYAMNNASGHVAPYTGGAAVSKVFYPADGSTVTITSTGAVIKQSPGHTAYREGWVRVSDISCINSQADLSGRIAAGSSNPYTSSSQTTCMSNAPQSTPQATTPTPSVSANATANASVVLAGSTESPSSQTTAPAQAQPSAAATTAASLPNTGPGSVVAISGIATVLGTIGHFVCQRLRYRVLS